jgi:hypothetical protein
MPDWWGIRCKGCGELHPIAQYRHGDTYGRSKPDELFTYTCPHDNKGYQYLGKEAQVYKYEPMGSGRSQTS